MIGQENSEQQQSGNPLSYYAYSRIIFLYLITVSSSVNSDLSPISNEHLLNNSSEF